MGKIAVLCSVLCTVSGLSIANEFLAYDELSSDRASNCLAVEHYHSCDVVQFSPQAVMSANKFTFPNGEMLMREGEPPEGPQEYYSFMLSNKAGANGELNFHPETGILTGEISMSDGRTHLIDSCGKACTLWIEQDNSKVPESREDYPSDMFDLSEENAVSPELLESMQISEQSSAQATVSLSIYYTPELKAYRSNVEDFIKKEVADVNNVMKMSQIPLTIKAQCIEQGLAESGSTSQGAYKFLQKFARSKEGDMKKLLKTADLGVIFVKYGIPSPQDSRMVTFGIAGAINALTTNKLERQVAMTGDPAGGGQHLFAHELGHLFGGWHDVETLNRQCAQYGGYGVPGCKAPGGYELGAFANNKQWKTVMTYGNRNQRSIPFYSSATLTYEGHKVGDATHDVRRRILGTRAGIGQFGDESGTCPNSGGGGGGGGNTCRDLQSADNCKKWKWRMYCHFFYNHYMEKNCAKTCGHC